MVSEDGKLILSMNKTQYESGSIVSFEDGWVRAVFDDTEVNFYESEDGPRYMTERYVKPWSERWWKPWDSVGERQIDITEWAKL